jgi:hypothetical protein
MFLLNSRLGRLVATASRSESKSLHNNAAPLFPKLRGQFAEFLNVVCLAHLGLLDLPTCVGLRYGHLSLNTRNEVFLGSKASAKSSHPENHGFITSRA